MFVYEKFKEAEAILLSDPRANIENYFQINIDSTVDLKAGHTFCPVHDDSTESFQYFEKSDTFSCYGCGKGGNVIVLHKFVMKREIGEPDDSGKITYSRALLDLAKMLNIPLPSFYSEDNPDEIFIKPKIITSIDITGLSYRALQTSIDKKLGLLRQKDFGKYLSMCKLLDSLEYINTTKDEKKTIYNQLLQSI